MEINKPNNKGKTLICSRCVHTDNCKWSKEEFKSSYAPRALDHIDAFFNFREKCIQGQLDWTYTEKHVALKELKRKVAEWKKEAR